jgi:hypothetical protein
LRARHHCRLASGGSFALRQLFTDEDEILFHATRPVILNGIEDVICRADLADRAVFLTLGPISNDRRRSERELWREFESARPRILGALLDGAVRGLQKLPQIRLQKPPRMADFALWVTACETVFWPQGTFMRAYEANRQAGIDSIIEADPVATLVREVMAERGTWAGQASDLLQAGLRRKNAFDRSCVPRQVMIPPQLSEHATDATDATDAIYRDQWWETGRPLIHTSTLRLGGIRFVPLFLCVGCVRCDRRLTP